MFSLYKTVIICVGYVFSALLAGFLLSISVPNGKICRQITGFAMEFASGFTVSVFFLNLIPSAYTVCRISELILFLILGIFSAMFLQEKLKYQDRTISEQKRLAATEELSVMSFAVSNFMRGISVGTGFGISSGLGFGLGVVASVGTFPEGSAIFLMSKTSEKTVLKRLLICLFLPLPFLVGALLGINLGVTDRSWLVRMLLFSGGVTLYSAVGDISIESKLMYHGRFIPFFNILGMMLGTTIVLSS